MQISLLASLLRATASMASARQWASALAALSDTHESEQVADAFVAYAHEKDIGHLVPAILAHLARIAERATTHESLVVAGAHELDAPTLEAIRTFVGAPHTAPVHTSINQELIGGFVAEHGGKVYNGSIARQLETLRASLATS